MKHSRRIATATLFLLALLPASTVYAQAELKSSNYTLDSVNFGSSFNLLSSKDGIPPVISSGGAMVTSLESTQVVIEWKTDKKSDSAVEYGLTQDLGKKVSVTNLTTSHKVTVTGLDPHTTYKFRVSSTEINGAIGTDDIKTFTTPDKHKSIFQIILAFLAKPFVWLFHLIK
jgi:hypothetical protein